MSQKNANEVAGDADLEPRVPVSGWCLHLGDWFWSQGVSLVIRALSLHGSSGAFSPFGSEGPTEDAERSTSEGADACGGARESMSRLELESVPRLSEDDGYEPAPVVIQLRRPLVAVVSNRVVW